MLLATFVLLLHPQMAGSLSLAQSNAAVNPPDSTVTVSAAAPDTDLPLSPVTTSLESSAEPRTEASADLPDEMLPVAPADPSDTTISVSAAAPDVDLPLSPVTASLESPAEPEPSAELPGATLSLAALNTPAPMAFIKPAKPYTVSVDELRAENRRKELLWRGLIVASSGAATFDAWSTRHAITTDGAQELNPLLKPFAGNDSLYVAIQVAPAILDYVGRKMMYSRHSWMRRVWWVPQSASFASSLFCGAHNLAFH